MVKATLPGHMPKRMKGNFKPSQKDNGCKKAKAIGYSGSCLDCSIDPCLEDPVHFHKQTSKYIRNIEIRNRWKDGASIEQLIDDFGLCRRQIQRIVSLE